MKRWLVEEHPSVEQGDRLRELELDVPQVTQVAESFAAQGRRLRPLPITVAELVAALS